MKGQDASTTLPARASEPGRYVTVTPDLRFEVSRRIREEFDNGK
jgi:hypothetical protein